mmetsp:Transcript_119814/g.284679  ORF Transcript_119814/g.284679 Transcript_119814/m.284679 type:complete len:200 (+) Transcript_119814:27-626(+)
MLQMGPWGASVQPSAACELARVSLSRSCHGELRKADGFGGVLEALLAQHHGHRVAARQGLRHLGGHLRHTQVLIACLHAKTVWIVADDDAPKVGDFELLRRVQACADVECGPGFLEPPRHDRVLPRRHIVLYHGVWRGLVVLGCLQNQRRGLHVIDHNDLSGPGAHILEAVEVQMRSREAHGLSECELIFSLPQAGAKA